jgi:hypothetical protein
MNLVVHQYEVIMSHPDEPEEGVLGRVQASCPGEAALVCQFDVDDPRSVFAGYDFTVWPVPVA